MVAGIRPLIRWRSATKEIKWMVRKKEWIRFLILFTFVGGYGLLLNNMGVPGIGDFTLWGGFGLLVARPLRAHLFKFEFCYGKCIEDIVVKEKIPIIERLIHFGSWRMYRKYRVTDNYFRIQLITGEIMELDKKGVSFLDQMQLNRGNKDLFVIRYMNSACKVDAAYLIRVKTDFNRKS